MYAGVFEWSEDGFTNIIDEQTVKLDTLLAAIRKSTIFLGEAALLYKDRIQAYLGEKALFGTPQDMIPSPANVAYLCMRKARNNMFDNPEQLVPRYMRKSEAEMKQAKE